MHVLRRRNTSRSESQYRSRFLGALAVVLLLITGLVQLWPAVTSSPREEPFQKRASERIQTRDIQPTAQSQELTPPPPAPVPPRVVPNDQPIEEEIEFGEGTLAVEDPGQDARLQEGTSDTPIAARQPDTDPRLFRAVQPDYPEAARKNDVQARIEISVQVSKTGRVTNATILRRWRLSATGPPQPVGHLEYGLEAAALAAARRSRFRPAEHKGVPVASRTTITFEFGPSDR